MLCYQLLLLVEQNLQASLYHPKNPLRILALQHCLKCKQWSDSQHVRMLQVLLCSIETWGKAHLIPTWLQLTQVKP